MSPDKMRREIAGFAQKGAAVASLGKMCGSCAFKLNSAANMEPRNVQVAYECLAYNMTFNCHVVKGVDAGCECVGFKYAQQYFNSLSKPNCSHYNTITKILDLEGESWSQCLDCGTCWKYTPSSEGRTQA